MKISGKDSLSSSFTSIGVIGGSQNTEINKIEVVINQKTKNTRKFKKLNINDEIIEGTYFKQNPVRQEESGSIRHYIEDTGKEKYFEIFVWVLKKKIIRYDLHYDIFKDEKMLSWKINQKGFIHTYINSERVSAFGLKQIQTMNGSVEIDRKSLINKFKERYSTTIGIKKNKDRELNIFLDFINSTLNKL